MKIVDIISGTMGSATLPAIVDELRSGYPGLSLISADSETLDSSERSFQAFLDDVKCADMVVVHLHAGITYFKKFDRLRKVLTDHGIPAFVQSNIPEEMEELRSLFPFPADDHRLLHSFVELGGDDNERGTVLWALRRIGGVEVKVPEPVRPRTEGIYHPDRARCASDEEFLSGLDPTRPTVGILFPQSQWLNGDLAVIESLVRCLEDMGANALPVFFISSPNSITGSIGAAETVRKYFIGPQGPRVRSVIVNVGFSQLALGNPGDGTRRTFGNFFQELDVPVVQAMTTMQTEGSWEASSLGLTPMELGTNVVWPEFDGQIISVPIGFTRMEKDGTRSAAPIVDRVRKVASMALAWGELHALPPEKRKVAILMHQNPPRNDQVGGAFGLDAPESVALLLRTMASDGYVVDHLPGSGDEVVKEVLAGVSNDLDWLPTEEMAERAVGKVRPTEYAEWFASVPSRTQEAMCRDWGRPPGTLYVSDGKVLVPGVLNGNIFIGLQPPRGLLEKASDLYHSTEVTMPHNYLAYYRWLKEEFGAHAVIHMGTHGTLEWLPGKGVGLSSACPPDVVLEDMPNLYPYVIGNPGEGMQAKRRSGAVIIDHLIPTLTRGGSYDELTDLDNDLQEFFRAQNAGQYEKASGLLDEIAESMRGLSLEDDVGLQPSFTVDDIKDKLSSIYDYVSQVKDNLIKDGLHVLGRPPSAMEMNETVRSLTRLNNGQVPSLRTSVSNFMGVDLKEIMDRPWEIAKGREVTNGAMLDDIDGRCMDLIERMGREDYDLKRSIEIAKSSFPGSADIEAVVIFICATLVPNLLRTEDELGLLLHGLSGGYVPPGPSGCVSRGNAHLLPTGRNFYSIDPSSIPSLASWGLGVRMADQMITRYVREKGTYPESVGVVVFASDTMKTGGDDIAYILWLMGLQPLRSGHGGSVVGLEIVPLEELGRPRLDVTVRITGLFRDVFPGLVELLDDGVRTIAALDESEEDNFLIRHMREETVKDIAAGIPEREARNRSVMRIFGCPPGGYGGGVSELIETSEWKNKEDIARSYISWGCHVYGRELHGERRPDLFQQRLGRLEVTVKNHESRELDMLETDDDYIYLGGMNAAVSIYGDDPMSLMGDSSDPDRPRTRSVAEEAKFVFRSRALNPKWLEGLKKHGYRGAQEISQFVDFAFGWDATMDIVEPWMYNAIADRFMFDEETRKWIEEVNPYALRQIAGRLLEAAQRGMWDADEDIVERLQSIYLDSEDILEGMGEE